MRILYTLLLFTFVLSGSLRGQNIDYKTADTLALREALEHCFSLLDSDLDLFVDEVDAIWERSSELNYRRGMRYSRSYKALYYYYTDMLEESIAELKVAEEMMKADDDIDGLGNVYNYRGVVYDEALMHDEALDAYELSLGINQDLKDTIGIANLLNNIAVIRERQGLIEEAEQLYNRALIYYLQSDHSPGVATIYNNLGMISANRGDLEEALSYYLKSLKIEESISSKSNSLALSYNNLGSIYSDMDNHELAIYYYQTALNLYTSLHDRSGVSMVLANMAYSEGKLGENKLAVQNALEALDISLEIQSIDDEVFAREVLSEVYYMTGDYKRAFDAQSKYKLLSDSLMQIQMTEIKNYMEQQATIKEANAEIEEALEPPSIEGTHLVYVWLVLIGLALLGLIISRKSSRYKPFILALFSLSIGGLTAVAVNLYYPDSFENLGSQIALSLLSLGIGFLLYTFIYQRIDKV